LYGTVEGRSTRAAAVQAKPVAAAVVSSPSKQKRTAGRIAESGRRSISPHRDKPAGGASHPRQLIGQLL
jgi:hypothetical protein